MVRFLGFLGWLSGVLSYIPLLAAGPSDQIEVPIGNVLIPHEGFDDNDRIEMVVTGEFPHSCFTLGETKVERDGNTLRVRQYAWAKEKEECGDEPMPFSSEVSVGRLAAGDYEISYLFYDAAHREKLSAKQRFKVEKASKAAVDEFNYASVSSVSSQLLVSTGENVTAQLNGLLSSVCEDVGDVKILKQKDVFVVLPLQEKKAGAACPRKLREFRRDIGLGALEPGQYLIHVRSMNGKAVNRVFFVLPPN